MLRASLDGAIKTTDGRAWERGDEKHVVAHRITSESFRLRGMVGHNAKPWVLLDDDAAGWVVGQRHRYRRFEADAGGPFLLLERGLATRIDAEVARQQKARSSAQRAIWTPERRRKQAALARAQART